MSLLNVEHLTHGFGDRAIFDDVSFRLLKGEHIGLVGANGEGKSTFMNIITGKLMPDEGRIEWAKNIKVGYLDQHSVLEKGMTIGSVMRQAFDDLFVMEERMNEICDKMMDADDEQMTEYMEELGTIQDMLTNHDFYMIDAKVEEVARALGLLELGLDKDVTDLSGGQRTKVLLGKLLLEKPDILLLDEPTNYLDKEHIDWLKRYLLDYENAFILISHDIPFLNSVINIIYHMDNQQLNRYVGDYYKFQEVYEMKQAQMKAAYDKQQKEIADLKDFVARNKARVATRNMAMSRQKKLDNMEMIELAKDKPKPEFNFKVARTSGKYVFTTKDLVIGYDEPLSKPLNFEMERGKKIVLTGANGIGKSTLLKSLLGLIKPLSGEAVMGDYLEIGYFEQEMPPDINTTCLEEIWQEFPGFTQYEVRSALAKCGLTTKHIESKVRVLSGGEQAKVRLCKLVNRESNILVLDEPTNHLDVDAKEELKRALIEYKGSILMELAKDKPKPEFNFKVARTSGKYVFTTKDLVIGYDEPLSKPLNFEMERGKKIVLTGANGIGKSTLLKSLLGLIKPLSGEAVMGDYLEIGYFEQEMPPDINTTCLEEIWQEFPGFTQYEVRSALAKCGLTTKHIESKVRVLSGGEQAKVRLCKLVNRESNILVLDEPTNHLDVDAKEELKRALIEYKGSILMVCHEPEFYDGLATDVWDCSEWTTRL